MPNEARGRPRPYGSAISPLPAILTRTGLRRSEPEPVAVIGFDGQGVAIVVAGDGHVDRVAIQQLTVVGADVDEAIAEAEASLEVPRA